MKLFYLTLFAVNVVCTMLSLWHGDFKIAGFNLMLACYNGYFVAEEN